MFYWPVLALQHGENGGWWLRASILVCIMEPFRLEADLPPNDYYCAAVWIWWILRLKARKLYTHAEVMAKMVPPSSTGPTPACRESFAPLTTHHGLYSLCTWCAFQESRLKRHTPKYQPLGEDLSHPSLVWRPGGRGLAALISLCVTAVLGHQPHLCSTRWLAGNTQKHVQV